ncbi:MAG TPA: DinB family protein [Cyclobacteriaceae bacterium]|nr:DinB family protein [Cyclobacteriaceae bacterium]
MENKTIATILASQYKASLGMLRQAVERVPQEVWNNEDYSNPNWKIAYHVIWGVKFYLGASAENYVPFENAIEGAESLGGYQDWENPEEGVIVEGFHTKEELLSFISQLEDELISAINGLPLEDPSGFEWYPYSRLELHINSIRHIQHHTAQIIERLKAKGITGFPWRADENPS